MRLYQSCCISVNPMNNFVSFLGGRDVATSFFTRRSINGRKTVCNFRITFSCPEASDKENQASNCSESPNISGNKKFNNAHNSCKLFCNGVPVISNLKPVSNSRTALLKDEFSFLIRWASSIMRYFHGIFPNAFFSFKMASYEHTMASNLYFPVVSSGLRYSARALRRSSLVPPIRTALMEGHHLRNSLIQFPTTDLGTMTRWGPLTPRASRR
mmetsp:Transcript_21135/g.35834  ORF Transcript_21135/g.35834 Transcript_21135/m.35834 type:complete len:213 (+) Transcript_21135:2541-3179(+)